MRETCHEVLKELGTKDDLLEVAMELEHIALNDPYFIEKKLYPNVDFYSGIILKAMGIPSSMFTVIFAMARTVGWIAHWNEMHSDGMKIARPRQLYTGYENATSNPTWPKAKFDPEDKTRLRARFLLTTCILPELTGGASLVQADKSGSIAQPLTRVRYRAGGYRRPGRASAATRHEIRAQCLQKSDGVTQRIANADIPDTSKMAATRALFSIIPPRLADFAIAMENFKAEQRAMMFILIHRTASAIRQAWNIQQRMGQGVELLIIERRCVMPPAQPDLPENLHA